MMPMAIISNKIFTISYYIAVVLYYKVLKPSSPIVINFNDINKNYIPSKV